MASTKVFGDVRKGVGEDGRELVFDILGLDLSIVNALRRAILTDVETAVMCSEPFDPVSNSISVTKNSSSLHNEQLARIMSLVPIHFDENEVSEFGRDEGKYKFELDVTAGASGTTVVTTKAIAVYVSGPTERVKAPADLRDRLFPACRITGHHITITSLRPGQEVRIEAHARLGSGSQHARWCPTSTCHFINKIDESLVATELGKLVAGRTDPAEREAIKRRFMALDAARCYSKSATTGTANAFEFHVVSECGMRPEFLVFQAFVKLRDRAVDLAEQFRAIGTLEAPRVTVKKDASAPGLYVVSVARESHTLGNLVQSLLYNKEVRTGRRLEFIGYTVSHPLTHSVAFKVKFRTSSVQDPEEEEPSEDDVTLFFATGLEWIARVLASLAALWYEEAGMKPFSIRAADQFVRTHAPTDPAAQLKHAMEPA